MINSKNETSSQVYIFLLCDILTGSEFLYKSLFYMVLRPNVLLGINTLLWA